MRYKILLTLAILAVYASFGINETSAQPPNQKPIKQQKEVTEEEIYKRFITEDVPYIITKAEIDAFKKLQTNEERENFIALFWKRRDTNPDTEENEYREEYYERIAYANDHFTAGIPVGKRIAEESTLQEGSPIQSNQDHPAEATSDQLMRAVEVPQPIRLKRGSIEMSIQLGTVSKLSSLTPPEPVNTELPAVQMIKMHC